MKYSILIHIIFLVNLFTETLSQGPTCGRGTVLSQFAGIVGGTVAKKGNWGWQVVLKLNGKFICGGSLINNQWVVTAAHCMFDKNKVRNLKKNYRIDIGVYDRTAPDSFSKTDLLVSNIHVHPEYEDFHDNDIALLKLKSPVKIDKVNFTIVPVCLPKESKRFQNKNGFATGYGVTEYKGTPSNVLREVDLPVLNDQECSAHFPDFNVFTHICAGKNGSNRDTCQGDSGGPLVGKGSDGRWYLIGISSYGKGCGNVGVYTRSSAFADWIYSTIRVK